MIASVVTTQGRGGVMWLEAAMSSKQFVEMVRKQIRPNPVDVTGLVLLGSGTETTLNFEVRDVRLRTLDWEKRPVTKSDGGTTEANVDNLGVEVTVRLYLLTQVTVSAPGPLPDSSTGDRTDIGDLTATYLISARVTTLNQFEIIPKYRGYKLHTSHHLGEAVKPVLEPELQKNAVKPKTIAAAALIKSLMLDPSEHGLVNVGINPRPYPASAAPSRVALLLELAPRPSYPFSLRARSKEPSGDHMPKLGIDAPPLMSGNASVTFWSGVVTDIVARKVVEAAATEGITVKGAPIVRWGAVNAAGQAGNYQDPPGLGNHTPWTRHGVAGTFSGEKDLGPVVGISVSFTVAFAIETSTRRLLAKVVYRVDSNDATLLEKAEIVARSVWEKVKGFFDGLINDDEGPTPPPSASAIPDGMVISIPLVVKTKEFGQFTPRDLTTRSRVTLPELFTEVRRKGIAEKLPGAIVRRPPSELAGYLTIGGDLK